MIGMSLSDVAEQLLFETTSERIVEPEKPTEKVIWRVPCPAVIDPFRIDQEYVRAPVGAEAVIPVPLGQALAGAVMVAAGGASIGTERAPEKAQAP
jgi:hypothetical protein